MVKNPPASAENSDSIPESGRSPGGGNGNPLQYSCLGNLMDRGACPWHYSPWGHRVGPNLPTKQQQSATLGQILLDPETAKVNERWKPSSAQLRGKDYPTSTIAKCWHVGTQASAMASGLCLSSLAPPVPAPFSGAQTPSWKEGLLFPLAVAGESQGKTRLQCPVEPVMEATGNEIAHCLA